jgi:hypothetical protein
VGAYAWAFPAIWTGPSTCPFEARPAGHQSAAETNEARTADGQVPLLGRRAKARPLPEARLCIRYWSNLQPCRSKNALAHGRVR